MKDTVSPSLFSWLFSFLADVTYNFDQVVNSNSPESCWAYLTNLEKRGNPHTDINLLNKLKDCYSKVFFKLPVRQYSKNATYARILVRYAELKGWVSHHIIHNNTNINFYKSVKSWYQWFIGAMRLCFSVGKTMRQSQACLSHMPAS